MTSVPFLALGGAVLTYFFSRKKVTSQVMKATRGARYWSLVQKVLSLFLVTGTYSGLGRWWGRSGGGQGERQREGGTCKCVCGGGDGRAGKGEIKNRME